MMIHRVVKPFASALQRFRAGDVVTSAHDLSPHSLDSLKALGLIAPASATAPSKPAAAAADNPATSAKDN